MLNFCDIYSKTEVYAHLIHSLSKMTIKIETNNSPSLMKIVMNHEIVNYSEKIIPNYL